MNPEIKDQLWQAMLENRQAVEKAWHQLGIKSAITPENLILAKEAHPAIDDLIASHEMFGADGKGAQKLLNLLQKGSQYLKQGAQVLDSLPTNINGPQPSPTPSQPQTNLSADQEARPIYQSPLFMIGVGIVALLIVGLMVFKKK
jgi:hypothetical protein